MVNFSSRILTGKPVPHAKLEILFCRFNADVGLQYCCK
jgi:hypothetical protein